MASASKSSSRSGKSPAAVFFNDVSPGRSESQLRFRLIHFWEAKNIAKGGVFLGMELLLIDQQGTVMQGFITPNRCGVYRSHLKAGSIYTLQNFFAVPSKEIYRVADQVLTISFSNDSVLSPLSAADISGCDVFPEDRFRLHYHADFVENCGRMGDLHDVVGHLRLVNGQSLQTRPILEESDLINLRHILVHLQIREGPVMKLYLWDAAAREFFMKFTASKDTPTVLMVTTVNPKDLQGKLSISSMASSRVFLDKEVQPTSEYLDWLMANPELGNRVNADEVTRVETMTIGQILAYIKHEDAKEASFYCVATIDDVVLDRPWYYIGCSACQTKATKGPSSLMCAKCGNNSVTGVANYLARITVYDNNDQGVFVLLGDAGKELTGKTAAELVDNYFESNEEHRDGHLMPAPQVLVNTIGQTHKFKIKVSKLNLTGKIEALTVVKVISPEVLPPLPSLDEVPNNVEDGVNPPTASVDAASVLDEGDGSDSRGNEEEAHEAKRPKLDI